MDPEVGTGVRGPGWTKQPWKGIYLLYNTITLLSIRIPLWYLLAIPKSNRPRPSWTIKRTILVKLLRHYLGELTAKVGRVQTKSIPNHTAIFDEINSKGVWIPPAEHLVVGALKEWAAQAGVECVRIPGYWLYREEDEGLDVGSPPRPGEKVFYCLHGGGYAQCSAHPSDPTAHIARGLLEHVKTAHRAFSVEYRLATGPPSKPYANSFPAALLDALAGYHYLVHQVGFSPDSIIVVGDSAGGNLALALTRYVVENQHDSAVVSKGLPPPPGELVLSSPWVDLGDSHFKPGGSVYTNKHSDYIGTDAPVVYSRITWNFIHPFGKSGANTNSYISPASTSPDMGEVSFKGFPRSFIIAGGAEVLLDQIRTLKDKMVKDLGEGQVEYVEPPDAVHDFLTFRFHEPERTEALKRIASWLGTP